MARIELSVYFEVASVGGIMIEPALAGTSWDVAAEGAYLVHVEMPVYDQNTQVGVGGSRQQPVYTGSQGPPAEGYQLNLIRARVIFDDPFSAADVVPAETATSDTDETARYNALGKRVRVVGDVARHAVARFLAPLKASRAAIGLADSPPRPVAPGTVTDIDAGVQLPFYWRPAAEYTGVVIVGRTPVARHEIDRNIRDLNEGIDASIAESLLADAFYAAMWIEWPDAKRAVLLAAIAVELRTKAVLRERARPEAVDMVNKVIPDRAQSLLPIFELLDSVCLAALGHSLRADDPSNFGEIRELFELRNALAHRGVVPDSSRATELVRAAAQVFEWLESA